MADRSEYSEEFLQYLDGRGTPPKCNMWDRSALEYIHKLKYLSSHFQDKLGYTLTFEQLINLYEVFEPIIHETHTDNTNIVVPFSYDDEEE